MSSGSDRVTPEQARRELAAALNAIEDRINVPKRLGRAAGRGREKFATLADEKPAVAWGGIAGAATLAGVGVWAIVKAISSR